MKLHSYSFYFFLSLLPLMAHGEPRGRWDHDVEGGGGLFGVITIVIIALICLIENRKSKN